MKNFIFILKKDKRLGFLILPWLVEKHSMYYRLTRIATEANTLDTTISETEKKILKLTKEYEEHVLHKIFDDKHLSEMEFWRTLEKETIKDRIRPYIENRLVKIFKLLQQNPKPLFLLPDPNEINVYPDKKLTICTDATETIFNFNRLEEGTQYFLTLHSGHHEIHLFEKKGFILADNPCLICIENKVMLFEDIEGKKLIPFFKKEHIAVPQRMEETYYAGFIKNSLEKYHVKTTGFDIVEEKPEKQAVLEMETDFLNECRFTLSFRYGEKRIPATESKQIFVRLEKDNKQFRFFRWKRDRKWEKQRRQLLIKNNLTESSQGIFQPTMEKKGDKPKTAFKTEIEKLSLELQKQDFELMSAV